MLYSVVVYGLDGQLLVEPEFKETEREAEDRAEDIVLKAERSDQALDAKVYYGEKLLHEYMARP